MLKRVTKNPILRKQVERVDHLDTKSLLEKFKTKRVDSISFSVIAAKYRGNYKQYQRNIQQNITNNSFPP